MRALNRSHFLYKSTAMHTQCAIMSRKRLSCTRQRAIMCAKHTIMSHSDYHADAVSHHDAQRPSCTLCVLFMLTQSAIMSPQVTIIWLSPRYWTCKFPQNTTYTLLQSEVHVV